MAVNPELAGRRLAPVGPYTVGREKVREFARAVQSRSPLNIDADAAAEAGYGDVVVPPTFPVVIQEATLAQLLAEPDTGIDFTRVVHGDQRFSYLRPVVAGDVLLAELTVTDVKSIGGHSMVTAQTEVVDLDGELVLTAVSTLVVRGDE